LETVRKRNTKVTGAASESENNNVKVELKARRRKATVAVAAAANEWDRADLRREQLHDQDMVQILQEVDAGQRPEWKDIADRSPIYKSYWAQWKSLLVRHGVLERHCESADRRTKTAQTVLQSKMKEALTTPLRTFERTPWSQQDT
jgi:hypothetical protein